MSEEKDRIMLRHISSQALWSLRRRKDFTQPYLQTLTKTGPFKKLLLQNVDLCFVVVRDSMLCREMPGKDLEFGRDSSPELCYQIRQNIFKQQQCFGTLQAKCFNIIRTTLQSFLREVWHEHFALEERSMNHGAASSMPYPSCMSP